MTAPTEFCIMFVFADLKTFFVDDWKNKMSQLYYYNQGDFKKFFFSKVERGRVEHYTWRGNPGS